MEMPKDPKNHPLLKYFKYDHLPESLQAVSKPFGDLAKLMSMLNIKDYDQLTYGLQSLLAAKDCAVRSVLS